MQSDNRTCKPSGKIDPMLLYAATKSVNAFRLRTKHMYKVADKLNQVIGVSYDGSYVYWTDISAQVESVMRAKIDGSDVEVSHFSLEFLSLLSNCQVIDEFSLILVRFLDFIHIRLR